MIVTHLEKQPATKKWRPGDPVPEGHTVSAWEALRANAEAYEREMHRQRFIQPRRAPAERRAA